METTKQMRWKENKKTLTLAVRPSWESWKRSEAMGLGVKTNKALKGRGEAVQQTSCSQVLPALPWPKELSKHQF